MHVLREMIDFASTDTKKEAELGNLFLRSE